MLRTSEEEKQDLVLELSLQKNEKIREEMEVAFRSCNTDLRE